MAREIDSLLHEDRVYPPPADFSEQAHIQTFEEYKKLYEESLQNPEAFWARMAQKELHWFQPWQEVLQWDPPFAKWFVGGKLNVAYNCIDRHLTTWRKNKVAILWEGEEGSRRSLTYWDLYCEVNQLANWLKAQGVEQGDRVILYMPLVPEAAVAMLACARIGAIHSVVFGGFSAKALQERILDAEAKLVITADGGFRRGKVVPLKTQVDEALTETPSVEKVLVLRRTGEDVPFQKGRDFWWHHEIPSQSIHCPAEELDSETPLFILYTSGTTGKPKGILHTSGGYLLGVTLTAKWIFDLKEEDTFWCSADVGWITGHSYVVYGPLSLGCTTLMYEGAPDWPDPGRFWSIVERHRVSVFYTAPTAIRAFMKWGTKWPEKYDLSSLRLLGTVGEPINPEAWIWYYEHIGQKRCPIVDTWWQTETGAIMISPLPGAIAQKPGSATLPFMGVAPQIVNEAGEPVEQGKGGFLVITRPWPSMLRTLWRDEKRFREVYWSTFPSKYFTGDGARQDQDGYYWIMGRVDDVINVSGHRLGTMEVESALVAHPQVAEAAVVGMPHSLKGEAICAFVTLEEGTEPTEELRRELIDHVAKEIGPIAKPEVIRFTQGLPKTRSGKIMRRLLRDIAAGREVVGDTTTLEDYSVLAKLREHQE